MFCFYSFFDICQQQQQKTPHKTDTKPSSPLAKRLKSWHRSYYRLDK